MFVDIYSKKYMEQTTEMIGRMKFWLPQNVTIILSQNLCCKQRKQDRIIDASFRFHDEFYAKNTQRYFCGDRNILKIV